MNIHHCGDASQREALRDLVAPDLFFSSGSSGVVCESELTDFKRNKTCICLASAMTVCKCLDFRCLDCRMEREREGEGERGKQGERERERDEGRERDWERERDGRERER